MCGNCVHIVQCSADAGIIRVSKTRFITMSMCTQICSLHTYIYTVEAP